ncbi:hypothetical protein RN001_000182 [Aquatica leii]|uniref:Uncharacterized protein n=1 Tax=Aquatica leii TaxID=1421715 RepID=A0AAN7PLY2_9COLE|nr:hypothetical protein RN001_000182 [Aquatica leii]
MTVNQLKKPKSLRKAFFTSFFYLLIYCFVNIFWERLGFNVTPVTNNKARKKKRNPAEWNKNKQKSVRIDTVAKNYFKTSLPATENRGGDRKLNIYKTKKDSPVKESYFRHIFNTEYNLGFGTPKSDVCSTCLQLTEKIKTCNDNNVKTKLITEKQVHKMKAQEYFKMLRKVEENVALFSFECQKNQVMPKVPDQEAYYSREFYMYNFTVVQGMILTKNTKGTALVRGENLYNSDLGVGKGIAKRGKNIHDMNPTKIVKQNTVSDSKKVGVNNLLISHYGAEWKNNPHLKFYKNVAEGEANLEDEEQEILCEEVSEETNVSI